MNKSTELKLLKAKIALCKKCFGDESKRCLFGAGNPDTELMVIGEGPSFNRVGKGIPFGGKCRKVFENTLRILGETRRSIWATNAIKCSIPGQKLGSSMKCRPILITEMAVVNPKFIIIFGRAALQAVFKNAKISVQPGGYIRDISGKTMFFAFHPGAVDRGMPKEKYEAVIWQIKRSLDVFRKGNPFVWKEM